MVYVRLKYETYISSLIANDYMMRIDVLVGYSCYILLIVKFGWHLSLEFYFMRINYSICWPKIRS